MRSRWKQDSPFLGPTPKSDGNQSDAGGSMSNPHQALTPAPTPPPSLPDSPRLRATAAPLPVLAVCNSLNCRRPARNHKMITN